MVQAMEEYLLRTEPAPDPTADEVTELVAVAERRTDITRADQLATHAGVSLRTLQRMFADYVGVGPKWVVRRCRILDAAEAAHSGSPTDWAALADRKSVGYGKSVSVRVDLGGRRLIKKKNIDEKTSRTTR